MTGKDKFERELRSLISDEMRRRKIGKFPVICHVVRVANSMSGNRRMEFRICSVDPNAKRSGSSAGAGGSGGGGS